MKTIEPINVWKDGENKQAIIFKMYISYDDLQSTATFQYDLCDSEVNSLINGSFSINGDDYINWGTNGNSNEDAYVFGASVLNLVITGNFV